MSKNKEVIFHSRQCFAGFIKFQNSEKFKTEFTFTAHECNAALISYIGQFNSKKGKIVDKYIAYIGGTAKHILSRISFYKAFNRMFEVKPFILFDEENNQVHLNPEMSSHQLMWVGQWVRYLSTGISSPFENGNSWDDFLERRKLCAKELNESLGTNFNSSSLIPILLSGFFVYGEQKDNPAMWSLPHTHQPMPFTTGNNQLIKALKYYLNGNKIQSRGTKLKDLTTANLNFYPTGFSYYFIAGNLAEMWDTYSCYYGKDFTYNGNAGYPEHRWDNPGPKYDHSKLFNDVKLLTKYRDVFRLSGEEGYPKFISQIVSQLV